MDPYPSPVKHVYHIKDDSIDKDFTDIHRNAAASRPLSVNQNKFVTKLNPKHLITTFKENHRDKLSVRFRRNILTKKRSNSNLEIASHNQPKRLKYSNATENVQNQLNDCEQLISEKENQQQLNKNFIYLTSESISIHQQETHFERKNRNKSDFIENSYGENWIVNGSDNMSIYDYHYDSTSNSTNGSSGIASNKYITGAKNHNAATTTTTATAAITSTSANDGYYSTDLSIKQQLCDIALSMASLCNIGNSCYMNSVIYTLRFTPLFLHNLHHLVNDFSQIVNKRETQMKLKSASLGRNVSGLQGQNSRSYSSKDLASLGSSSPSTTSPALEIIRTTQQIAMEKLHDLFKNLTTNEMTDSIEPYQSDLFLKAIQDVNPIFEGNQQQDAHEFLMCILDSIRESCQSIVKIINDHPEIIVSSLTEGLDRLTVKTAVTIPPTTEKKSNWFVKIREKNKNKTMIMDSPSKDSNSFDTATAATTTTTLDATNDKTASGSAIESLLLNKRTIQEKIKALGLDFFSEDFEGVTASSIQCLACETTTEQKETMIDLSVPITENMETHELNDSFIQSRCITRERFHGDNKFRCENCMGLTEAIRKISYPKLPRLLIIQLKRFSGGMEKINSYIPTPFTLQCFCATCISDYSNSKGHEYKLYSVITHVGSTLQAGHYIAYTCALNQNNVYFDCFKNIQTVTTATDSTSSTTTGTTMTMSMTTTTATITSSTTTTTTAAVASSTNAPTINNNATEENSESISIIPQSIKTTNELNRQSSFSTSAAISTSAVKDVMKKIGIRRKKSLANNIDAGKHGKTVNGLKVTLNGIDGSKLQAATPTTVTKIQCPSNTCCGIRMKTSNLLSSTTNQLSNGNDTVKPLSNGMDYPIDQTRKTFNTFADQSSSYFTRSLEDDIKLGKDKDSGEKLLDDDAKKIALRRQRQTNCGGTNNTAGKLNSEPIWYMCDDDKIKAIPQNEFREMLLPKKNMITPYLLFYARNDVFEPH